MLREFSIRTVQAVRSAKLFLIELAEQDHHGEAATARRIADELLTDPVVETCSILFAGDQIPEAEGALSIEVHPKPGVMDPVAQSTALALTDMGVRTSSIRTAHRFELSPIPDDAELRRIPRLLGNDCIEDVIVGSRPIEPPPSPPRYEFALRPIEMTSLAEAELLKLSRDGHLFLSLPEMIAIQSHFRSCGREPTDIELETLAQTWSEHCVHKTLKSPVLYRGEPMPSIQPLQQDTYRREIRYRNLLKDTIARATAELMAEGRGPHCLSVFKDNAGIIAFDDEWAVAIKVETHNHPSAIEPYGGAATGVGGVIRDVLGCGLGAKPIANTDVFCVAHPNWPVDSVPKGVIHPRTVLRGITAGVRDYGNCMGIPTVNGAVRFDPRYLGNPLVFCGCIGVIPRDRIEKQVKPGDAIVVIGGRTGRDGIHGATFSSAELTDTHEDEFSHAVQIGSPIEEKKVLDLIVRARDFSDGGVRRCLFSSLTDCGAGGLSSAIGEMADGLGAEVDLEKVPLKYAGLRYDEIWISESQERMVLAVPLGNVEKLLALAAAEEVEATAIGRFTESGHLNIRYCGNVVGDLDLRFLHEGVPKSELIAEWEKPEPTAGTSSASISDPVAIGAELLRRLAQLNIASKHWLIHQYDHEVQSRTSVRPLVAKREGPSDAAVIRPRLDSDAAVAIGCGLNPELSSTDPYWMAVASIDEALRNVVCVGGDPARTAILDNFCWPRVDNPANLGALVRACQACYDLASAYNLPFISGKDSLNNEFALDPADVEMVRTAAALIDDAAPHADRIIMEGRVAIPCTLLISALSIVDDVRCCTTSDLKSGGTQIFLVGRPMQLNDSPAGLPPFDAAVALRTHMSVARLIRDGVALAVHDASDGGPLTGLAEMCFGGWRECTLHTDSLPTEQHFIEAPALYLVQVSNARAGDFERITAETETRHYATVKGEEIPAPALVIDMDNKGHRIPLDELYRAWRHPLDW
jgi:phosphoribosylformylglycinamidine synthase